MCEKNVIIGNGLIAKSLTGIDFEMPVLVFASGVSNSMEVRSEAFLRESKLLEMSLDKNPGMHVLYCSTCSIESGIQSPYINHKLAMENMVLASASSCHIFRLPQVVGLVSNNTLVSYFIESILRRRVLRVQTHATRNLLDVRDFVRIASQAIRRNIGASVPHNLAPSTQVSVADIVDEIAKLLGRSACIEMIDSGYNLKINSTFLHELLLKDDPLFEEEYWRCVLQYYVPQIAANYLRTERLS